VTFCSCDASRLGNVKPDDSARIERNGCERSETNHSSRHYSENKRSSFDRKPSNRILGLGEEVRKALRRWRGCAFSRRGSWLFLDLDDPNSVVLG
jgi:hypothetical protein